MVKSYGSSRQYGQQLARRLPELFHWRQQSKWKRWLHWRIIRSPCATAWIRVDSWQIPHLELSLKVFNLCLNWNRLVKKVSNVRLFLSPFCSRFLSFLSITILSKSWKFRVTDKVRQIWLEKMNAHAFWIKNQSGIGWNQNYDCAHSSALNNFQKVRVTKI